MAYDSVHVDPAAAGAALQNWKASVDGLRRTVTQRSAAIESAETARPWGGDGSGQQFGAVYTEGAAPSRAATYVLADQLADLGSNVDTALQASLASDEVQAAALAPAQDALDPR